ncbi:MAG: Lrp/AsnC family transcriptional regulator, partial [Chloroflexi bacterium]|nr:Lrp/AsnC family transcriptional regulator [Chloroflexota bacterium]
QTEFPLTREPYARLGWRLGASGNEIIQRIEQLKRNGVIRLIGPVLDSRSLGYHTTLVAMKVAQTGLEKVEQIIIGHPGVSHGYEREHQFNLWFTLALPTANDIETELEQLTHSTSVEAAFSLPAVKVFKIGAFFDMDKDGQNTPTAHRKCVLAKQVELSRTDRLIINELQQDLALVPAPFSAMAERVGMDVEQFLAGCRSLQQRGVIRRFSASINHKSAGFTANAMSCWTAPSDRIDGAGQKLASLKEVSHCYERSTNQVWHYNLFAMIHGRSRELCREIAERISGETGLTDYALLYSTKEFKKTRVKYLV